MFTTLLVSIAIVAFAYYFIVKPRRYWTERGVAQGNPAWVFGHIFGVLTRTQSWTDTLQTVYRQCSGGRYTGMYSFHIPILVIKDIDLVKQMAVKDFDHFMDHNAFLPADSDPLFSKNLFALQGKKWREMRAVLSPFFTSNKMRSMFPLMVESAENFVDHYLKREEGTIAVEMKNSFSHFTTDVIATTACGIKVDSLKEPNNDFYVMGQKATQFDGIWKNLKFIFYAMFPPIKNVLKINFFDDDVATFFRGLIDETIKVREEKGVVRPDMIHLLLELRKGIEKQEENNVMDTGFATVQEYSNSQAKEREIKSLSNEDITAQALIFFLAGFETASILMCFATYELAVNPDIQEKLRKEVFSTWKTCSEKLTYEALLGMKYMDMVISETLRKWPPNIASDRECTKPYTIEPVFPGEKPIYLKQRDQIWFPTYSFHRDPNFYPDPDKFDPERFSDENKGSINPYTYIPFGLGPRNCIGSRFALMEAKVIIFHILLHFELVPVEKTLIPMKISKKKFALDSEGGFWLGLKKIGDGHS